MPDPIRVSPARAKELHQDGALIVATYPEDKFRNNAYIAEAISADEFASRLAGLPEDARIIFY